MNLIKPDYEVHYAPINGGLSLRFQGNTITMKSWAEHHELMAEFISRRANNEIVLKNTITQGHAHFHGHVGRVNVYVSVVNNL
jgi:hypothetical protein